MRKIYSIVLTACTLLVSVSLSAAVSKTLPAGNQTSLFQEFVNLDDDVEITLTGDVNLTSTVNIYSGKKITLNLNGHNIEGSFKGTLIVLYHGNLDITGTGIIKNTSTADPAQCIQVEGQMDHNVADWSVLTIGENVTVIANEAHGKAIVIDGTVYAPYYTYISQEFLGAGRFVATDYISNASNYEANALTTKQKATSISIVKGTAMYSTLGYATKVPVYSDVTTALYKKGESDATSGKKATLKSLAYGVKVVVNGHVSGGEYGIKTNGTVVLDTDNNTDNMASVIVSSTSKVEALNSAKSAGIASNGYSHYTINGEVRGGTGVYVKGGEVDIQDAVIASTYQGEFNDKIIGAKSGVNAGGTGIVIESNVAYAGGQKVTISGDTKVSGTCGYGIQETVTTGTGDEVSSVTVLGGTIEAGDQGAMIFDKSTLSSGDDKIQIVGGNVHSEIYVLDEDGQKVNTDIKEFIPEGNYSTTEVTDPKTGKTTIVVTELEDGVTIDKTGMTVAAAAAADKGLNWTNDNETLTADATLPYLEINANKAQVLTVNENVTLTVGRVVMGTQAQIIVKAGARLIVDGKQGIVAPVASNIILETQEGKPAQFLFNPGVSSNRHPSATVMFTSKAYRKADGSNIYQFFGSPFTAVTNVAASSATYATQLDVWNVNKYDRIGIINYDKVGLPASNAVNYSLFNKAFGFYSMMTNNPQGEEQTYTFTGTLVGNDNAELPLYANWAAMSNSYMGTINMDALIEANRARRAEGMQVTLTPYVYSQDGNELHWNANNPLVAGYIKNIAPMQPFMLQNTGDYAEIVNDYADLVWTPATTSNAPARRNIAADMTKATIRVNGNGMSDMVTIAESAEFTAELDELDAVMYPNTDINLYAMAAEKMSVLATDDVENTYIGFACPKGGEFTLTFAGVEGNALTLIDLKNNTAVDMTEGATYTFTAAANEANDYRFKVVGRHNAATALENTAAAAKAEGIYTLTGMYLGNMSVWNTLPAGIYVVNGEKMVK